MEWKRLTTREADEEEREQGYAFIWDCETPEIGEECLTYDGKYIRLDTWTEFDFGVGFENIDNDGWWMPLPELPREESDK